MRAETPPMTVKELREFIATRPTLSDSVEILDEMKTWYFANCHLITTGEDAAFKRGISNLIDYVGDITYEL